MVHIFLSQFQWYRKLCGGIWLHVRIDLADRPMFWTKSQESLLPISHTILDREER